MSFALTQKLLTFMLAISSAVPLMISDVISLTVSTIFAALILIGWFLEPPITEGRKFRQMAIVVIVLIFGVQGIRAATGAPVATVSLEFAMILMGIKLCTRSRFSDYQQIIILAFLHIIGATIATFEFSYAVLFILFLAICPATLAMAHLRNEMERRFRHDNTPKGHRSLKRLLASKRVVSAKFIFGTTALSLPVLLFTIILFVVFPRFGLGLFGGKSAANSIAGFTNEVHIGDIDLTRDEQTVILRLEPLKVLKNPPHLLSMKMRGAAFDLFENNVWKQSALKSWRKMKRTGNLYRVVSGRVSEKTTGFSILQESLEPPYLFLPLGTGRIETEPVAFDGILKPRMLEVNAHGVVRYQDLAKVGVRYKIWITGDPIQAEPPNDNLSMLTIPDSLFQVTKLGKKIAGTGSKLTQAKKIVHFLKKNYRYANENDEKASPKEDTTPIGRFLFSRRSGTCEHFATSAALMMRSVGIPSRLVTGFSGAEWNRLGKFYSVKTMWAHAWTEAYINGQWMQFDPTPPAPNLQTMNKSSILTLLMDTLRMHWHKYVISYDASSQVSLAKSIISAIDIQPSLHNFSFNISWPTLGIVTIALLLLLLIWRFRNRLQFTFRQNINGVKRTRAAIDATTLFQELERKLTTMGFPRSVFETPLEYMKTLLYLDAETVTIVSDTIKRYNEIRFGGDDFRPNELIVIRTKIASITQKNVLQP